MAVYNKERGLCVFYKKNAQIKLSRQGITKSFLRSLH